MNIPVWEQKTKDNLKAFLKKNLKALNSLNDRDAIEGDTRTFVTDLLVEGFGYDKYEDLTAEMRIQHEFADIGIRIDGEMKAIVEVKRVRLSLKEQQLRQAKTYAANAGLSWAILTNGRIWEVYRISDTTPVTDHLLFSVDLLSETTISQKVEKLWLLSREAMKRDVISGEWKMASALSPERIRQALKNELVLKSIRTVLRNETKQLVELQKISESLEGLFGS